MMGEPTEYRVPANLGTVPEWPMIPFDVNPADVDADALWTAWVDARDEQ